MEGSPVNTTDHDLLIRVDTKLNQLSIDMKNLADGTTVKIANHEIRLAAVEQSVHDAKITGKFMIGLATGIGSLITFVLTVVFYTLKIFQVQ